MNIDTLKQFDVEVDLQDLPPSEVPAAMAADAAQQSDRPVVYIYNELDGRTFKFNVFARTLIGKVIAAFYEKANRQRDAGDRLTSDGNGENIFQFESLTIEQYLEHRTLKEMQWTFAGPHGGA